MAWDSRDKWRIISAVFEKALREKWTPEYALDFIKNVWDELDK